MFASRLLQLGARQLVVVVGGGALGVVVVLLVSPKLALLPSPAQPPTLCAALLLHARPGLRAGGLRKQGAVPTHQQTLALAC